MQLLGLLDYYERFEVDDHRGVPLSDADVKSARCEQLQALQRKAFSMESLQDFALSNLAAVDTPTALTSHFSRLQPPQLAEIASSLGVVHSNEQASCLPPPNRTPPQPSPAQPQPQPLPQPPLPRPRALPSACPAPVE